MEPNSNVNPPVAIQNPALPTDLFASAWRFFVLNWKAIVPIVIIPSVILCLGQILMISHNMALLIIAIVLDIVGIILSIAMTPAVLNAIHRLSTETGITVKIKDQYKLGFALFWPFVLLSIIKIFVSIGSLVLFIIPGIIVGIYISFCAFSLILDGKKGLSAFTDSYSLVKGRWMAMLWRMLFPIVIYIPAALVIVGLDFVIRSVFGLSSDSIGASVISQVLNIVLGAVTGPLIIIYTYNLYVSSKATRQQGISNAGFKKWLVAFLVIGIIVGPVFIIVSGFSMLGSFGNYRSSLNAQYEVSQATSTTISTSTNIK